MSLLQLAGGGGGEDLIKTTDKNSSPFLYSYFTVSGFTLYLEAVK
jgi:hypothetical protein